MDEKSVTIWLNKLKQGDQSAARNLWERYGQTLVRLARQQYHGCTGPEFDEEDLIQCVFTSLWTAATSGGLEGIERRDDLWWLLLAITRRKALSRAVHNNAQKRGGGVNVVRLQETNPEDSTAGSRSVPDPDQFPPDMILVLEEEQQRLLRLLRDDTLRYIAIWKLEGYTHEEIAGRLTVTVRTVARKLDLIRETWERELHQ